MPGCDPASMNSGSWIAGQARNDSLLLNDSLFLNGNLFLNDSLLLNDNPLSSFAVALKP